MVVGLVAMIAVKGLSHFWPKPVVEFNYQTAEQSEPVRVIGEISRSETTTAAAMREAGFNVPEDQDVVVRHLVKRGNRDVTGQDFVWYMESFMSDPRYPEEILVLERLQWGDFYGYLQGFLIDGEVVAVGAEARTAFERALRDTAKGVRELNGILEHKDDKQKSS